MNVSRVGYFSISRKMHFHKCFKSWFTGMHCIGIGGDFFKFINYLLFRIPTVFETAYVSLPFQISATLVLFATVLSHNSLTLRTVIGEPRPGETHDKMALDVVGQHELAAHGAFDSCNNGTTR